MPAIITQVNRRGATNGLVARPTLGATAVDGSISRRRAVDGLHNVQLAALRPGGAIPDAFAEKPEGGPDPLLVALRVVAEADDGFDKGYLARLGGEGLFGLDAARGPLAAGMAGDELDGAAAGDLDVLVGGGVVLDFVVDAQAGAQRLVFSVWEAYQAQGLLGDDPPCSAVGKIASIAREIV